jgi:subtilase family serine protease
MTDPEAAHTVDIEALEETARAGETAVVTVAVENEGSGPGETAVELAADGEQVDSETVEPDVGETETVELEWTPGPDAVGTAELAVTTEMDSATGAVTVEDAPAAFTVDIDATDEYVSDGGTVTVVAEITNEGTLPGAQGVELRAGETVEATRRLELDGQASETVEFDHEVTAEEAPETTLVVASEDDEAETSVPVVTETVTPLRKLKSKSGMGVFGWLIFLGMAILVIPLLPFLAVLKLIDMLLGRSGAVR